MLVVPIALSAVGVVVAGRLVPRPGPLAPALAWWVGITLLATVILRAIDGGLRHLLPVAALLKLSLVFPDRAPSRFKMAIRSGTVRQLQRRLAEGELSGATPQETAEQLIALAGHLNAHDRLTRGHTERCGPMR